ncbi:MAG: acyltransferase [Phormidesmis sp.]
MLDYWRAIAALWVMMFHGFGTLYDAPLHPSVEIIKRAAHPGWLGVHLFFVISGYCIAASLYRSLSKGQTNPVNFLISRAQRLLPVYWIAFLSTIAINILASPFNSTGFWSSFPDSWQSWLGNALLIQPYIDAPYYVVVYWSLVVEVGFYLIVAGLLLLNNCFSHKVAMLAGLLLGLISMFVPSGFDISVLAYWSEFLCGVLTFTALLCQHTGIVPMRNASLAILIVFIVFGSLSQFSLEHSQLWFSALFALLLYFAYPLDCQLARISSFHWLRTVGLMSYSLYLLHVPLQGRIVNLSTRFISSDSSWMLLVQALGWAVALIASYGFFRIVEKPLNDWRHQKKPITPIYYESSLNG